MKIFCTCDHDVKLKDIKFTIEMLITRIKELEWYREGIVNGSLVRITKEGKFAYKKVDDEEIDTILNESKELL